MNFPKPITDEELEYFARLRERDYLQFRDKWPDVFINVLERLLIRSERLVTGEEMFKRGYRDALAGRPRSATRYSYIQGYRQGLEDLELAHKGS